MKAEGHSIGGHSAMSDLGRICPHNECANIASISLAELPLFIDTKEELLIEIYIEASV